MFSVHLADSVLFHLVSHTFPLFLICAANAAFQSTGLVSCLSLCCSSDFPPAPPNNFHESDFYPYLPSVLSLGPVLTFKLDKLKVITE